MSARIRKKGKKVGRGLGGMKCRETEVPFSGRGRLGENEFWGVKSLNV